MCTKIDEEPILLVGGKIFTTHPHLVPLRARFGPQMRRWRAERSASATFCLENAPVAGPSVEPKRDRPMNQPATGKIVHNLIWADKGKSLPLSL